MRVSEINVRLGTLKLTAAFPSVRYFGTEIVLSWKKLPCLSNRDVYIRVFCFISIDVAITIICLHQRILVMQDRWFVTSR